LSEKERLFAQAEILKEQILAGDRSLRTLRAMAETLDKLEPLVGYVPTYSKALEVEPIA